MKNSTAHSKQSQLIAIDRSNVNGEEVKTVNARDLHSYLESKQDFSTWIKKRINEYGFIENKDFVRFHKKMEANNASVIEYHITIEMAKELSMVERNDKGKEMRQYFIECERQAKSKELPLNDPAFLRGTLLTYTEKVIELEGKVEEMLPAVEVYDRIVNADGAVNLTMAAKAVQYPPRKFATVLHEKGWIYRAGHRKQWLGYQDKVKSGYLTHKVYPYKLADGTEMMNEQVMVTPKGLTKLSQILSSRH